MNIAVVGTGYVGLVTAACLAELGNEVTGIDCDSTKIRKLKSGICPIYEAGLTELIQKNVAANRLHFTSHLKQGVSPASVVFIAVGTPPKTNGETDLTQVEHVARDIAETITDYKLIVEKSTVPVWTGERIEKTIGEHMKKGATYDVASNPEFLREGFAISDFMHPDRIVIGVKSKRAEKILKQIYQKMNAEVVVTDITSAELIKHASNSFLAMKISFINAIARICDLVGADVNEVARGIGLDKRIGKNFLNAGIGFGGFCFPKDLAAFIHISEKLGYDFRLLREVDEINKGQIEYFLKMIEDNLWNIHGKTVGVWGLSFKPGTDDMRFAPSVPVIRYLVANGAKVRVYDPQAMEKAKEVLPSNIDYGKDPYEVCEESDCLLVLTEWNEFKNADLSAVKKALRYPIMIDGRNMFEPHHMHEIGFRYSSVGRSNGRLTLNGKY